MNIDKMMPIQDVVRPTPVDNMSDASQVDQKKIQQFARDFEAVFISNLLDQMSATVDCLNDDKDGAAKQIDGIFRMQLSQNLSENGSLGLEKSIEQYVSHTLQSDRSLDDTKGLEL